MKDLRKVYLKLAGALEWRLTPQKYKRHAAILLRNAAICTPHCQFCGCSDEEGDLYESRYTPRAHICKHCAMDIVSVFRIKSSGVTVR